ncbi:MAG: cell division protein ZapA [Marinibacterium sp.]|nr:cell division protein ZapA [Marinibacterium sp.]
MPEVNIQIGGRTFEVSCQAGEESYLQAAAAMLNEEAQVLSDQIGRMPEGRMLLMSGLLLADRTAAHEDRIKELEAELETLRSQPKAEPERIEVPVVPDSVTETLADLAAQAEALAADIEERAAAE